MSETGGFVPGGEAPGERDKGESRNLDTGPLFSMPTPFMSLDFDLRITSTNLQMQKLTGLSGEELVGQTLLARYPELAGTDFEVNYRRVLETGQPITFEALYEPTGAWFEVHAWLYRQGLNVTFSDVTERHRYETAQAAELAEARQEYRTLHLRSYLSAGLAGLHTTQEVFDRLIHLVVPALADWCTLVVPEDGQLVRVGAAHRDPVLDRLAKALVGRYPHPFDGPSPGVAVYRSARPLLLSRLADQIVAQLDDSAASTAYGRTLKILGRGPGLLMPLRHDAEVVAVLTMVRSPSASWSDADLELMEELVLCVSGVLDDVRQVEAQREAANALQEASLPSALPVVAGLELASAYRAASKGSQVGGDWYDAFQLPSGRIALVVGDAVGHGVSAAALMAQLRNALRANLFASFGPLESLVQLSRLLVAQGNESFATIVGVELDPLTGEATWFSAGHPPPLLVRADAGSAQLPGRVGPPVGWTHLPDATVEHRPRLAEHSLVLQPGERLVLFTDGLYERRGVDLDVGLTHLSILAEQTKGIEAAKACEAILAEMLAASHEDDACLLIADFNPADEPENPGSVAR